MKTPRRDQRQILDGVQGLFLAMAVGFFGVALVGGDVVIPRSPVIGVILMIVGILYLAVSAIGIIRLVWRSS